MIRTRPRPGSARVRAGAVPRRLGVVLSFVCVLGLAPSALRAQGWSPGFVETFALAEDRLAAVDALVPGTAEWYRFRALALQHAGRYEEVPGLLAQWEERFGRTGELVVAERRQGLLTFDPGSARDWTWLDDELDPVLSHRRTVPGEVPDLPTALDAGLVTWEAYLERALRRHDGRLRGIEPRAFHRLIGRDLTDAQVRELLDGLHRSVSHERLVDLVVRELGLRDSRGFGSLVAHRFLTLEQLRECARRRPELPASREFVDAIVRRLAPPAHVDLAHDGEARLAWLERLEGFARTLPGSQDGFLAHVLYHRLAHDRARGVHDRARFLDYLALYRATSWTEPDHLRRRPAGRASVTLGEVFPTGLPTVGDDQALVRGYLEDAFRASEDLAPFTPYVRAEALRRVLAETRLLYGLGEAERWVAVLDDPAAYEALEQRVELEFAPTQPGRFAVDAPVFLDVDVKHVDTLLLQVFEVDAWALATQQDAEPELALDLDGLVPHEARTLTFDEPAIRRVRRRFELPTLEGPGTWIVELIGNGTSSRALVRKGGLSATERVGAAGHVFRVIDETGAPRPDATGWFAGREVRADARGELVVPFSTEAGTRTLVLRAGGRVARRTFEHLQEEYSLGAQVWTERESLRRGETARLVVRPSLRVHGRPVSLALLDDPVLELTAVDSRGTSTRSEVAGLQLADDAEFVHEWAVPEDLAKLSVRLTGSVRSVSTAEDLEVASLTTELEAGTVRPTTELAVPMLTRTSAGYVLEVRGRNGEPLVDRAVRLELKHLDFDAPLDVDLKTDGSGRIALGQLDGIVHVALDRPVAGRETWPLVPARRTRPFRLAVAEGEVVRLPCEGAGGPVADDLLECVETRHEVVVADVSDRVERVGAFLELRGLPAGEYRVRLRERHGSVDRELSLTVAPGVVRDGWATGGTRAVPLDAEATAPLQVTGVALDDEALVVGVSGAREGTRVHVTTTRWLPAWHPYGSLYVSRERGPGERALDPADAAYHTGRAVGDEVRYILERRFAKTFPGNMLARPTLLLNPWELRETETTVGGSGGARGGIGRKGMSGGRGSRSGASLINPDAVRSSPAIVPDLAWLADPAPVIANLRPDADGVVRVPVEELGAGHIVHVVAVEGDTTVYESLVRGERPLRRADLRLRRPLPADAHVAEQRVIDVLPAGASVVVQDASTSELELYDDLGDVFRLFAALDGSGALAAWRFLPRWAELTRDERLALYDEHACHELHLFLHEKDRGFFDEVVRPYLGSKRERTFLDRWLLDEDLSGFLAPARWARLNTLERILLARRLPEEAAAVERLVAEVVERLPPDPDGERRLFDAMLAGSALEGDALGRALGELKAGTEVVLEEGDFNLLPAAAGEALESLGYLGADAAAAPPSAAPEEEGAAALTGRGRKVAFDTDVARRAEAARLYRGPGRVKAYVEHQYFHRRLVEQDASLVVPNAFWLDLARADPAAPFLSPHVARASRHVNEMLLALAVLDLPFATDGPEVVSEGARLTLTTPGPALLVRRELRAAAPAEGAPPLLVGQSVYRPDERWRWVGGERRQVSVEGELLTGVVYGTEVVVSNPTTQPRRLELLVQVPAGAIAVGGARATEGRDLRLGPLESARVEVLFTFPEPGDFALAPAQVARDGAALASADARTLHVVDEPTEVDETSWEHVSQNGTLEQVLGYLEGANVGALDLSRVAWRMRDRDAYTRLLGALRGRRVFDRTLWGYAIHQRDARGAAELLQMSDDWLRGCGPVLDAPLVRIDPVERRVYEHVEFDPLVNERAHPFGGARRVLNADVAAQLRRFLEVTAHRPRLSDDDRLEVTYYLLLQDRVEEALATFATVDRDAVEARMGWDSCAAYLAFFTDDRERARAIAEPYRDHPVARWRNRFRDVLAQLDEVEGAAFAAADPDDRVQGATAAADAGPSLELELVDGRLVLAHRNLDAVDVGFYAMDVEFLFSANPFVEAGGDTFAAIRPNAGRRIAVEAGREETVLEVPEALASANVLVEARGGGLVRRRTRFAHSMDVRMLEGQGQVRVADATSGAPLPEVYVKVYARTAAGTVRFHKDGYTDLRGRFDYVAHSGEGVPETEAFAVLLLSEAHGATVREARPPAR